MQYIIGLQNPDAKYNGTPHNAGGFLVSEVARRRGLTDWKAEKPLHAVVAGDAHAAFVLPNVYMNNSGMVAAAIARKDPDATGSAFVVIHDDIDQPVGAFKIVARAGAGGHHGVESIHSALSHADVVRIKVGVAPVDEEGNMRKPDPARVNTYLLSPMGTAKTEAIAGLAPSMDEALEVMRREGVPKAMSLYNRSE